MVAKRGRCLRSLRSLGIGAACWISLFVFQKSLAFDLSRRSAITAATLPLAAATAATAPAVAELSPPLERATKRYGEQIQGAKTKTEIECIRVSIHDLFYTCFIEKDANYSFKQMECDSLIWS